MKTCWWFNNRPYFQISRYEVAVIDEIQMCKDHQRGWAWTRALLGIPADEIHVCGEVKKDGSEFGHQADNHKLPPNN